MKVPEKVVPLLFVLLLIAAFLLGRYQAQVEILRGGGAPQGAQTQGGSSTGQPVGQTAPGTNPEAGTRTLVTEDLWKEVVSTYAASKGSENAPVTMVEFTDYQCPFCARHFENTQPQIDKEYIETGKVRYLVRDLPLPIHPNAPAAAMAARCAGDQGKYWEMHDMLFEKQNEWSSGDTTQLFSTYAEDLGLDGGALTSCVSSQKHKAAMDKDTSLAQRIGASGTPAFLINRELVIGAQPFPVFEQAIEKGL